MEIFKGFEVQMGLLLAVHNSSASQN